MANNNRITLSDIARRADTSTMAVSVVLNGARSNTRVSDTTRQRILEIAAALNYTPNAMARGLKQRRTNTLGVLFNWAGSRAIHNLYSVAVLDGIVEAAAKARYHVLLYTERWQSASLSSAAFSDQRTDGVIIVAPNEDSDVVPGLTALDLPVTLISSVTDVPGVPCVTIDNANGVSLALDHFWNLGHRRIGFAGQGQVRHNMRERYEAYCAWLNRRNLPLREQYILPDLSPGNDELSRIRLEQMFRDPEGPTALFATNDDLAAVALDAARRVGVAVPEQLSVIGFDDVLIASLTVPKLTTVRQPLFEMGQQAARCLIETVEGRGENANPVHIIAPELIVRESTASPAVS